MTRALGLVLFILLAACGAVAIPPPTIHDLRNSLSSSENTAVVGGSVSNCREGVRDSHQVQACNVCAVVVEAGWRDNGLVLYVRREIADVAFHRALSHTQSDIAPVQG